MENNATGLRPDAQMFPPASRRTHSAQSNRNNPNASASFNPYTGYDTGGTFVDPPQQPQAYYPTMLNFQDFSAVPPPWQADLWSAQLSPTMPGGYYAHVPQYLPYFDGNFVAQQQGFIAPQQLSPQGPLTPIGILPPSNDVMVDNGVVDSMNQLQLGTYPFSPYVGEQPKESTWAKIAAAPSKPKTLLKKQEPDTPEQQQQHVVPTNELRPQKAATSSYPEHPAPLASQPQKSLLLDELQRMNKYNPPEMTINLEKAQFFVIKSVGEEDVFNSIKHSVWCSTDYGNKKLDGAFRNKRGPIYLFFSVCGSGNFCGVAEMLSRLDFSRSCDFWSSDRFKGQFSVKWHYVKDVPFSNCRHIKIPTNENKPIQNSRDTQELPADRATEMLKIFHSFHPKTSLFDDFDYYESEAAKHKKERKD